jgi:hypothetical protein
VVVEVGGLIWVFACVHNEIWLRCCNVLWLKTNVPDLIIS